MDADRKRPRDEADNGLSNKKREVECPACNRPREGNLQVCRHCGNEFCERGLCFPIHMMSFSQDAAGHNCCEASKRQCSKCFDYFCSAHNAYEHSVACTARVEDSESFQWSFIRQLHLGIDDPQDHSARSLAACRGGLNTVTFDGLDIGIATWNINHFQKEEQKRASMQRIFAQHKHWLDILVLQEVNASSDLNIHGQKIKSNAENEDNFGPTIRKMIYKPGPMMMGLSIGQAPKNAHLPERCKKVKTRLGRVDGAPAWLKPHQQEFYPLIYLEGGKHPINYLTSAAFYLNKLIDIIDIDGDLYWNKQFGTAGDGTDETEEDDIDTENQNFQSGTAETEQKPPNTSNSFEIKPDYERKSRSTRNQSINYKTFGGKGQGEDDDSYEDITPQVDISIEDSSDEGEGGEDVNFDQYQSGESDDESGEYLTKKEKKLNRQEENMRDIDPNLVADCFKINVDLHKIPYFRPIIVHKLKINGKCVNIAVVHTSPEGKKLAREGEYDQIAPFLEYISKDKSALWVIAGDYYLDPESNIASNSAQRSENPDERFKEQIKAHNLKFVISVSATNQSILAKGVSSERKDILKERAKLQAQIETNPEVIYKHLSGKIDAEQQQKFEEDYAIDPQRTIKHIGLTTPFEKPIDSVGRKTDKGRRHAVNKRADFFVCSPGFTSTFAGIINPIGGLLNVDPNHNALNWWGLISDHAPVGAVFSTLRVSEKLKRIRKDEKVNHSKRWKKAEAELSDIFFEAYKDIRGWYLYLSDEIKIDWEDGLYHERKLFYALLFYILTDQRFEMFQTFEVGALIDLPNPDLLAAEMIHFFNLCYVQNYEDFKALYTRGEEKPILLHNYYERENNKKWQQMKSSRLPRIVREAAASLRTLGYEIDDFDVTDKEQTYKGVKSEKYQ